MAQSSFARYTPAAVDDAPALPVAGCLPELLAALEAGANAVLVAPPGAGKTTLVPPALLAAPWRGDGRIVMLEPRRLAARAAATRMAALRGEAAGGLIGFRTRLESQVSPATRIEVLTEGLLLRRLLADATLEGVAAVVFDEIHERSLEADLALALCLDLQRLLRPDLRLIAMSATPDAARLAALLEAPVVASAGRAHPVTVHHAARDLPALRDLPEAMARAVRAALAAHPGDLLAFLPGMGEIRRTEAALAGCAAEVMALHGDLPPAEQDRALCRAAGRRVVLASAIAETSLTVPGVGIVVDGGFRRAPRFDAAIGLPRLETMRISRAAAEQRAGRAGREGPGVAIRLWTTALHRGLPAFERPEILEAELSPLLLACAAWGSPPAALPFADPPPPGALAAAATLLAALGALDEGGRVTAAGRRMAGLGAHPRLAALMLAAATPGEAALAADLAALLEERDPLRAPAAAVDIALRLEALAAPPPEADRGAIGRIRRAGAQYRRRLGLSPDAPAAGDPAPLLARAFPDRLAERRGEAGSFRLAGGGGARLAADDPLARAPFLAVAAIEAKGAARIRLAAPIRADALAPLARESVESGLDPISGAVFSRRRLRIGALVIADRTLPADPAETARILAAAALARSALPWTDAARQFQARVAWMAGLEPGLWPDLSDPWLAAHAADWLAPALAGATRLADLARLDLAVLLRALLPPGAARRLDAELPPALALPNGRAVVDYSEPVPLAQARAQAFYGLAATPSLAGGRVGLRLALLSPAGRPVAVTGDLAAFWRGAWAEVRREMRGRYPKHDWPENPGG